MIEPAFSTSLLEFTASCHMAEPVTIHTTEIENQSNFLFGQASIE